MYLASRSGQLSRAIFSWVGTVSTMAVRRSGIFYDVECLVCKTTNVTGTIVISLQTMTYHPIVHHRLQQFAETSQQQLGLHSSSQDDAEAPAYDIYNRTKTILNYSGKTDKCL